MKRTPRCRALTKDGERCTRTVSEGSEYCWQHSDEDDDGGTGGGGTALKKLALSVPVGLGILEIVKKIIEIIGPFLSAKQKSVLLGAADTHEEVLQKGRLLDFLLTLKISRIEKLLTDPAAAAALEGFFPGGETGLYAELFKHQKMHRLSGTKDWRDFAEPRRPARKRRPFKRL